MKTINETDIIEFLNDQNDLGIGKMIFRKSNFSNPDIEFLDSQINVKAKIETNISSIVVMGNLLDHYECDCDIYKFNKKICRHIVCLVDIYNECVKHNVENYKDTKGIIFDIHPIIYTNEKKIKSLRLTTSFSTENYQKICVNNIQNLFKKDDEFLYFANFGIKREQVDDQSLRLLDLFKIVLEKTNCDSNSSYIELSTHQLEIWMNFFIDNNIQFSCENEDSWLVTNYLFDSDKYDWEAGKNVKPFVNNKKKYSLKGLKDNDYFSFVTENKNYLFSLHKSSNSLDVYEFDLSKEKSIVNFISFIGKSVSKNDFYKLYLAIKDLFWNGEKIINSIYVIQQGLAKIDPVLEVKIFLHDQLEVLTAKLDFVYGERVYPYIENEINYLRRERFLEKKLLDEILNFFTVYNKDFQVFEIIDHQKWLDFKEWINKKQNDEYYNFKAAEGILFKPKKRKNFFVQGAKFENDFLRVEWSLDGFSQEDMKNIINAYIKKIKYVKLSNNKEINIAAEIDMDQFIDELKTLNISLENLQENSNCIIPLHNSPYLSDLYGDKLDNETKDKINKIFDDSDVKNELPDNLKNLLKDYQLKGYRWWKKLISLNAGGILADEMGLGKTMQSISVLADIYFNKRTNLPSLVICPSSLVYNWQKELSKFAPFIKYVVVDGSSSERDEILNNLNKYDVVITSLNLVSKDLEKYLKYEFYLQLIDEAQRIKSQSAITTKNVKQIKALHKFALTGTPIENSLSELWSIFDYLMPNYLYDYRTFKQMFEDKIIDKDEVAANKLKTKIKPFVLRRTKKEVLKDLPEKTIKIITSELNDEQKELYFTELYKGKNEFKFGDKDKTQKNMQIFEVLLKLRQICCSPKLIYENAHSNGEKFRTCMELVTQAINNGSKILIFSQFVKMIEILSTEFKNRKISHLKLTGSIGNQERLQLVDEFNTKDNIKVFLISLRAGGVGLTLTSADTVIHYDPWWNGSLEDQATDRAHRIGQKKNVSIYKLISKDSIEEKVLKLQESKKEMFSMMFDEKNEMNFDSKKSNISIDEILNILEWQK